jgi:hypothetical protein
MSVLNTIPDLECVSGTLMPITIPFIANQDVSGKVYDALTIGFRRVIDSYLHSGRYHSRAAALQKWFRAPTGFQGLFHALRGRRSMPRMVVYKEPGLSFAPEFVLDALPDVRIIHIYRDGRDCANSLVETYDVLTNEKLSHPQNPEFRLGRPYDHRHVPWWVEEGRDEAFIESSPFVRAIWMWKHMVRRCHDVFSRPEIKKTGQVMLLRYEDFVHDPLKHGRAVLDHLGGTPTRAFEKRLSQARTSSIGKHTSRPSKEIRAAEQVADEELRLYGYQLDSE